MVEDRHHARARREGRIQLLEKIDLAAYKKSDTLFLLGSGPSINGISKARWDVIARHDTIGFNFWLCHPFVPTLYFYERIEAQQWGNLHRGFLAAATRRSDDYRGVPKVVTELVAGRPPLAADLPPSWRENLYTVDPISLAARNEDEFSYALALLRRRGVFEPTGRIRHLFKYASTLSALIALGVVLRYRRIVLCGIDLWSQDYFYQDRERYPESADVIPEPKSIPHLTVRDFPWLVKMDAVIRQMRRHVLEPAGIEIYVEHEGSKLWPEVPLVPAALFESGSLSRSEPLINQ